jgi:hypothetical protein
MDHRSQILKHRNQHSKEIIIRAQDLKTKEVVVLTCCRQVQCCWIILDIGTVAQALAVGAEKTSEFVDNEVIPAGMAVHVADLADVKICLYTRVDRLQNYLRTME